MSANSLTCDQNVSRLPLVTDPWKKNIEIKTLFYFQNAGCLAFIFSSFLMKLFLLPTERINKITGRKGKHFDQCIGSVLANASVVCWPTCWWCADQCVGRCVGQCVSRFGFFTFSRIVICFPSEDVCPKWSFLPIP